MRRRRTTTVIAGLAGLTVSVLALSACGDGIETTAADGPGPSATSTASPAPPATTATATAARVTATGTPVHATTAAGVHVRNLDGRYFEGILRVFTVSRSCATPDTVQVHFKTGVLGPGQARLLLVDGSGRALRSSAHRLSRTDAGRGGDGSGPFYGVRDTWTLRQVAGPPMATGETSGWRVVLVTADSTKALARPTASVVPSCTDRVWHAPSPTLEVTAVRRDCTAPAPADGYVTARVRAAGLVYGQAYAIDGGASGNDLNNVPSRWAESYDGDMVFTPGIDRRPSPNGLPAPFPRTAFTVTVRLGPDSAVRQRLTQRQPDWFEARDETSQRVTVAVPAC